MKKIVFIINPISGIGQKKKVEKAIERWDARNEFDIEILYTQRAGHAPELSEKALKNGADIIVAVGGDGSINEVSQPLIGTDAVLGIIPAGSGNGLATFLKISKNVKKALEIIHKGNVKRIDTVMINETPFVSIAGVGFDALVAKRFSEFPFRGFWSYLHIVLKEYIQYKPKKYRLIIDGINYNRRALFVSMANSNQFGYNTTIAPDASIYDGLIDICIVRKVAWYKAFMLGPYLLQNRIDKSKYVEIIQGKEIYILRKRNKVVNIDGEAVKLKKNLKVNIVPQSLNLLVP